jgi:putative Mn2+ efflux pump MntP
MNVPSWLAVVLLLLLGAFAVWEVLRYYAQRDDHIDTDDFGDRE